MSRCYPYPPSGYQKKAPLPDLSVPAKVVSKDKKKSKDKEKDKDKEKEKKIRDPGKEKKSRDSEKEKKSRDSEKEKKSKDNAQKGKKDKEKSKDKEKRDKDKRDKDKKDKRKKDSETNGVAHDKDPRSSKLQRTSFANNVPHSNEGNGKVLEVSTSAAVEHPIERDGRDAAKPSGSTEGPGTHPPPVYIKKDQPNGKVDPAAPPLVLSKPVSGNPLDRETAPSVRPSNHNHHVETNNLGSQRTQKLPDFSIYDKLLEHVPTWSTLDDEDWLYPSREKVHPKPKAEVGEDTSQQVWAEAVYLPSVDMYALPYVVPY